MAVSECVGCVHLRKLDSAAGAHPTPISAATPPHRTSGFRADIQGLRAIAVLAVVAFHAAPNLLPGGFVGVDIFFVISGYLIAGILMNEMAANAFSLARFYERRVRRIFPALFALLVPVLVSGALLLPPGPYNDLGRVAFSAVFFVSNIELLNHTGYFDHDTYGRPLLHMWSLAVEEQFYIFFPLALFALHRFARRYLRLTLIVLATISLAACEWTLSRSNTQAFYLVPFRAYEFTIGATIAGLSVPARFPAALNSVLSVMGLMLMIGSMFVLHTGARFPGLSSFVPCAGAALVLWTGAGQPSAGGRLVSGAPFQFFGDISYSLYLWHWPVLTLGGFALLRELDWTASAALAALSIGLAALSRHYIERPFQKPRGRPIRALMAGMAGMALTGTAAAAIALLDGLPARLSPTAASFLAAEADRNQRREECHRHLESALWDYADACTFGAANSSPQVAVWADSFGAEIVVALGERLALSNQSVLQLTSSACPPAIDFAIARQPLCERQNALTLRALINDKRIDTVLLALHYQAYSRADRPRLAAALARTAEAISAAGKRVIVVYPIPTFSIDVPSAIGMLVQRGDDPGDLTLPRSAFDERVRDIEARLDALVMRTGSEALRPASILCDARRCGSYRPDVGVLYFNNNHLSLAGARLLAAEVPLPKPRLAIVRDQRP